MANALNAKNYHLLNAWQRVCMADVWLFNQISGKGAPIASAPDKGENVYLRFERERIAAALQYATNNIAAYLHYWPRPQWFTQTIPLSRSTPFNWQELEVERKKLIAFGVRNTSVIQAGAAIVYSDPNGYGVNDTASITVATTVSINEIQAFYTVADGAQTAANELYQIEPLTVTDNGNGTVTLTGHRALFVKPSIWKLPYVITDPNQRLPNSADTQTAADFVTTVDVYRVFNDTTTPISLYSANNTLLQQYDGEIVDSELGFFRLGHLCTNTFFQHSPTKVQVNYYAGEALQDDGQMDSELEEAIVSFANAFMDERYSSFSEWTLNRVKRDQDPMLEKSGGTPVSVLSPRDTNNPFGLRSGEIRAWKVASGPRSIQMGGKFSRSIR